MIVLDAANDRPNGGRRISKAKSTPKKSARQKTNKKATGTVRMAGTIRMGGRLNAVDTSYVTSDPYQVEVSESVVRKCDSVDYEVLKKFTIDNVTLTTIGAQTATDAPQRLAWRPPEYTVSTTVKGDTVVVGQMDSRGVLDRVTGARVVFTNVSGDEITIRGNTPKSVMDQQGDIANRTNPFEITLKENQTKSVNVGFGVGKRGYPHLIPVVDDGIEHIMYAILDYYVIVGSVSKETGAAAPAKAGIVRVNAQVHYEVAEENVPGATITKVEEFAILGLKSFDNVFLLDPPIHGLFSDDSRKQLYTTDTCWRPIPVCSQSATVPLMCTLMAGPEDLSEAIKYDEGTFVYIPGAQEGDLLLVPTPIALTTSSTSTGAMSNVFINIGAGNFVMFESTTVQTLTQRWVLADNAVSKTLWDFGAYANMKPGINELAFPASFTVGYWPGNFSTALGRRQAVTKKEQLKYRDPKVKIALVTVIAWLSAAVEIVKIVKGALGNSRDRKRN